MVENLICPLCGCRDEGDDCCGWCRGFTCGVMDDIGVITQPLPPEMNDMAVITPGEDQ